jgi:hypothetical protein
MRLRKILHGVYDTARELQQYVNKLVDNRTKIFLKSSG